MNNEELKNTNTPQDEEITSTSVALDDEQRVKVLTPAMLVFKRFIRNKLAITGMVILLVMFIFSFIGPFFSPYKEDQVFRKKDYMLGDFASATYNSELRYTVAEGHEFSQGARAKMMLSIGKGETTFESDGFAYELAAEGDNFYTVYGNAVAVEVNVIKKLYDYVEKDGSVTVDDQFKAAFEEAHGAEGENLTQFTYNGVDYSVIREGRKYMLGVQEKVAVASMYSFDVFDQKDAAVVNGVDFRSDAEFALINNDTEFESLGVKYTLDLTDNIIEIYKDGQLFAGMSGIIVNPADGADIFLDMRFKNAAREAIAAGELTFMYTENDGTEKKYELARIDRMYYIKTDILVDQIDMNAPPSDAHWLGTDANGMDLLTRLMYGGRVSLMVGFIVVIIELFIGVLMGGVSGYFGGWVDTCIMRFVDLFNCIPYYPMMIIIGSLLDAYKTSPQVRIYLLMVLLGVMGWTGIARVVRGQILSLREQDFMVATEAAGIKVSRRIFRHLVPNVMPLLIVQATMSLGSIIITEATLSFLGLGVKYPLASWGSIINSATDIYVMRYYWWAWIPAGVLILVTVLGFNFVGDGLRDAFDPKMKR